METMFWVWLAVIVVSVIIELITFELVSIWFSAGAVIPFILAGIGGIDVEVQIAVFVVVSALLIIFVRKYAQKLLFKNMQAKTNIDTLIGKEVRLLEDTDFEKNGSVKINDVVWTAVSIDGKLIKKGSLALIVNVEGNKLLVKQIQDKKENSEKPQVNQNENLENSTKEVEESSTKIEEEK